MPSRPAFVVCDTDATIQFLLAREVRPLQLLRSDYGIQPILVPEVEIELRSNRRFSQRISQEFKKALNSGLLKVLDRALFEAHYDGAGAAMAATAALAQIAQVGAAYEARLDFGEAYTHAAALALGVPAMSHDRAALDALIAAGWQVPSTVLRAFDLVTLAYQSGAMTANECDAFRGFLAREKEYLPACFKNKGFLGGLPSFCPRLNDPTRRAVGSTNCKPLSFSQVIVL